MGQRHSEAYLVGVVQSARDLGVKEPHQLFQSYARVASTAFVQLGIWVRASFISRSDVVEQVVVGRRDRGVSMRVVESSFLQKISTEMSETWL